MLAHCKEGPSLEEWIGFKTQSTPNTEIRGSIDYFVWYRYGLQIITIEDPCTKDIVFLV
jgi:hypothetical protein